MFNCLTVNRKDYKCVVIIFYKEDKGWKRIKMVNREQVLNVLRNSPEGLTTGEIKRLTDLSYPTTLKWLEVLSAEGAVSYRTVGRSKLWYASEPGIDSFSKLRAMSLMMVNLSKAIEMSTGEAEEEKIKVRTS